eukprot:TRINITY_DN20_c1_g1_i1.p1 TRINITY_DN20_c1_g1~~TRINITY_DN20_c1_g1_i1.p1  ORF type:complete len:632 (+),score=174.44 TRINITY_DN20_c1_g1_i1:96-1991(+)
MINKTSLFIILILGFIAISNCFYLPGIAPKEFQDGEPVPLKVNKMVSAITQLPYEYYSLNFCKPPKVKLSAENLGEILLGDKIENSLYKLEARNTETCKVLCVQPNKPKHLKEFETRIREEYRINWIVDNLPAATRKIMVDTAGHKTKILEVGFPLGYVNSANVAYLNNHVSMKIIYHMSEDQDYSGLRIVGFEVEPQSIEHEAFDSKNPTAYPKTCLQPRGGQVIDGSIDHNLNITYTYGVVWEYNADIKWSSRWDIYFTMTDTQIHWFAIVNSFMIVLFLTGMVAMIMMRTVHADFRRYREMDNQEDKQEETGWKLVHGDVFRPPSYRSFLAVCVGSGMQVFGMTIVTLIFALLGFLSPANRGGLMTAVLVLYVFMGLFAGYFSTRLYKIMKGTSWRRNAVITSVFFPSIIFVIFFILNIFLGFEDSSGYVHFGILLGILLLWFGISIPLAFFGSYLGFKKPPPDNPVRTNQIPRQIPDQVWYMKPYISILMGGILPFGAIFIELFFILTSIWQHQFYYMFGFLFIVFVILVLTCAEITVVMCYFQLCSEDYHWWWRSFLTSGASAFYMFLYAIFYFFSKLHINSFVSVLLYFGYTVIMTIIFFLLTGSVGFYSCYFFIRKIYDNIKVA